MALGNIKKELADKYGKALFDAAQTTKSLDLVTKDATSLLDIVKNQDMGIVIHNPLIKKSDKKAVFSEFASTLGWNKETLNLIFLMIENNRIFAIQEVIEKYLKLVDLLDGKLPVTVIATKEISTTQQDSIRKDLEAKFEKPVKLIHQIDPKILGGMQIKIDSLLIDGSLQGKLQRLKNVMKGVN